MSLQIQMYTMGMMLGGGLFLGVVYEAYRVIGEQFRFPRWLVAALDLIYWVLACVLIFRMLYASNFGEVRLYVFIGLVVGVWIYYLFLSKVTVRAVLHIIRTFRAVVRFLQRLGFLLVVKPFQILYKSFPGPPRLPGAIAMYLYKFVVQLTYPIGRIILWPIRVSGLPGIWNRFSRWLKNKFSRRQS